jgi:hypothetical protein
LFAFTSKLTVIYTILSIKAKTYEIVAYQVIINSNNIQLIKKDTFDALPAVTVYDSVIYLKLCQ